MSLKIERITFEKKEKLKKEKQTNRLVKRRLMTVFLRDRQVAPKLSNCLNNEVKNGKIEKCKNVNKIFLYNFHTKTVHLKQKNVFSSNKKMLGRLK